VRDVESVALMGVAGCAEGAGDTKSNYERCVTGVWAPYTRKMNEAYGRYLNAIAQPFADSVAELQACTLKQEAVVADAKTAKVSGANVTPVMQVLVASWEFPATVMRQWKGYCQGYDEFKRPPVQ
jgi:hypothetical protein